MRYLFLLLPVLANAQTLRLAPPKIPADHVFFQGKTRVPLAFDLERAVIRYALDVEPGVESAVYHQPIELKQSCTLQAQTFHPDFAASSAAKRQFIRVKYVPSAMRLGAAPNKSYPGNGALSMFDLKKGGGDLHDGHWLGFAGDTVVLEADFKSKITCKKLLISTLRDLNAWVMPLRQVEVYGKNKSGAWQKIGQKTLVNRDDATPDYALYEPVALDAFKTAHFKIVLMPYGPLPAGHAGAGSQAWLFLDEIVFE
jgi:hexosaminidase